MGACVLQIKVIKETGKSLQRTEYYFFGKISFGEIITCEKGRRAKDAKIESKA